MSQAPQSLSTYRLSYLMLRIPVGVAMLVQGTMKLSRLTDFVQGMVKLFTNSKLPFGLVSGFASVLPYFEVLCGLLLVLGLFTRIGALLGWALMVCLILGSSMVETGGAVFTQLFYALLFTVLFLFNAYNWYSLDRIKKPTNFIQ